MSEETRNRYFAPGHDTKTELSGSATKDAVDGKSADDLGGPTGGTIGTIAPALAGVALSCSFPYWAFLLLDPLP